MKTIGFSHNIPLSQFENELKDYRLIFPEGELNSFSQEEVMDMIQDCDVFITMMEFPFPKELIQKGKKLKIIANLGSGFNNIDVNAATERGIFVLNTPVSVIGPTSEMTMGLILSITRSVVWYDRTLRKELLCHRTLLFERDMCLENKVLGVIGFGRIGQAVAKKAKAFGMKICYFDIFRQCREREEEFGATYYSNVDDLLKAADVVTIHMSYTSDVYHFIDKNKLGLMKKTSYLVNASRGAIVCEKDLLEALKNGKISGAALDVFETEPQVSKEIASLENVVVTPHISTNISEVRYSMLGELITGIKTYFEFDEVPGNAINAKNIG